MEARGETFTPALAERVLTGHDDMRSQSPEVVAWMQTAFKERVRGGTLLAGTTPNLGGGSQSDVEASLVRCLEAIKAITGVSISRVPRHLIQRIWRAGGFARPPSAGERAPHAWGVAPDLVEITHSSLGDGACPFLPAKGFRARRTCP